VLASAGIGEEDAGVFEGGGGGGRGGILGPG